MADSLKPEHPEKKSRALRASGDLASGKETSKRMRRSNGQTEAGWVHRSRSHSTPRAVPGRTAVRAAEVIGRGRQQMNEKPTSSEVNEGTQWRTQKCRPRTTASRRQWRLD
ncbi:hypothetical protein BGX38DRAFT_1143363 [Terfezia claveryi]|nr:hypothetical protein BGX38DRAFT_1143363 [Terfezia claveryi]